MNGNARAKGHGASAGRWVPGLALALLASPLAAQRDSLARAFDLERRGNFGQAAELYRAVLAGRPGEVNALLGLERVLTAQNRLPEILPAVRAGLAANPRAVPIYGVGLRAFAAAGLLDSLPRLVDRWAAVAPGDETPFREWGTAALERRDLAAARRAYQLGRERLGAPEVLAAELAQLAVVDRDWATAVREWTRAVRQLPGYRSSAVAALGQAPEADRDAILRGLAREGGPEAARLALELRARWGDPVGAARALLGALPPGVPQQIDALQQFLEQVRVDQAGPYRLAQAMVLEALAERVNTPAQQARYRLEAARAYADAGDRTAARRMLSALAGDGASAPAIAAGAAATLIELLVAEGSVPEAAARLDQFRPALGVDEYLHLRRLVAAGYARHGDLGRASRLLEADSSVEAIALQGRFRLYAGDLRGASETLRQAGPFTGSRSDATERAALLALLQPIEADSLPELGAAFQALDRGDTAAAALRFEQVARGLPAAKGGAELRLLAGRLLAAREAAEAERLFRAAMLPEAPGAAAAASLELARLLLRLDRRTEAMETLEQMILAYPGSALVPQARRLLDQARSAVPRT
ncbi:MAG TPA: hypothetical protein VNJ71_00330 [Gemmatimonadales bacterium]|nr:hypothetical protein [Gemmatimonadales bacterium]